nr:hypothetical protein [Sphingomonas xinjiangensis]
MVQLWPTAALLPRQIQLLPPVPIPAYAAHEAAIAPAVRRGLQTGPDALKTFAVVAAADTDVPVWRSDPPAELEKIATLAPRFTVLGPSVPAAPASYAALALWPDHLHPLPDRWSAAAWAVARSGTGLGAAPGGSQLGGSQAGVRVAWLLSPSARLAVFGRVTAPLRGRGAEAALGLDWQPTKAPLRLVVERRAGLDGIKAGFGAGVVGGTDHAVAPGFRLETYGQAGIIQRTRLEPYADGAARLTRQLAASGAARLSIGGGVWGAAQRDANRLDIGPSVTLTLPVARQTMRLALDWRQRIAGEARPGSGIALTLGSDF